MMKMGIDPSAQQEHSDSNMILAKSNCSSYFYGGSPKCYGIRGIRVFWYLLTLAYVGGIIATFLHQFLPLYDIKVANCPASSTNAVAAWPAVTAPFYLATQGFSNISQNADWYFANKWYLFPGKKGIWYV
jgi:hypothetical protein